MITIKKEIDLNTWETFGEAQKCLNAIRRLGKVEELEALITETEPFEHYGGITETYVREFLWFEDEFYCDVLDISYEQWVDALYNEKEKTC